MLCSDALFLLSCRREHLVRVLVPELVQAEAAGLGDLERARERLGVATKKVRHGLGVFEMPLGVGLEAEAGLVDGAVRANAGDQVEQRLAAGSVHAHVVGRDQRRAARPGQDGKGLEAPGVAAAVEALRRQVARVGESFAKAKQGRPEGRVRRPRRQHDQHLALAVADGLVQGEAAVALLGAPLAQGEQAAEPAVGRPVARVRAPDGRRPGA
jgi:hypothetical protein